MRDLLNMPARMHGRPVDHRGYPVPWFVTQKTEEGLWDFRVVTPERRAEAIRHRKCWVSGERLGRAMAFVLGPMCIINRVSSDPPVIPEIGEWSARICPFLSRPLAKRPEFNGQCQTPGIMVEDNPGLCAVWVTRDYVFGRDGLFHIGDPVSVSWWRCGTEVSGDADAQAIYEHRASLLGEKAAEEGPRAVRLFEAMKAIADRFSPAACARQAADAS